MFTNQTNQNTTANSYLPDMFIFDQDDVEPQMNEPEDETLLLTLVEQQHRNMGYGPVSSVFSRFLAFETEQAA